MLKNLSFEAKIFYGISLILMLSMIAMSYNFAPSNDERYNVPYADLSLDYYTSFGTNDTVLTTTTKMDPVMKHYGIAIELPAHAISRWVGLDLFGIRHAIVAFVSFFYIFFGALLAKKITKSWNAAFIAFILLIFTPRIFGESMNNPKDPTYCATSFFALYTFFVFLDSLPKPSWKKTIFLMIGIACSLLIRISGLISEFLFVFFLAWELFQIRKKQVEVDFKDLIKKLAFAFGIGYFIGILFWPAMINNPIFQPFEALAFLKNLPVTIKNLFEGSYLQSTEIPWYYLPKYFLISNPEITLLGMLIGFFLLFKLLKKYNANRILFLLATSLFPLFLIIYGKTGLLTGWRHGYFIYVPLVVFSSITFTYFLEEFSTSKIAKKIVIFVLAASLIPTLIHYINNFPYFYVYFNPTFGGVKKALGNYELDYYSHSLKPATDWLYKNEPNLKNLKIASNNTFQVSEILKQKGIEQGIAYIRYRERYDTDWDYALMTQSFVDADYLKNGYFPPKGTIKTIDVNGVPICAIIKRMDKNDFYGKQALDSNRFQEAIVFLNKAIQFDPLNELAWTNLGYAQLQTGNAREAITSFNKASQISPENFNAQNGLAYAYLQTGDFNYAINILLQMIEQNPNIPTPYMLLSKIYQQQGKNDQANYYNNIYNQIMGGQ
jgi:Flp pilus assembly protein TadD